MGINSIAMGVEEGKRYRFNKYVFPFVDSVVWLYYRSKRPVPISDIVDWMKYRHGISGVRNVYEGRDAALEDGYVEEVRVGKWVRYVPTVDGAVDAGIYIGLQNSRRGSGILIDSVPCALRIVRVALLMYVMVRVFDYVNGYVNAKRPLRLREWVESIRNRYKEYNSVAPIDEVVNDVVEAVVGEVVDWVGGEESLEEYLDYFAYDVFFDLVTLKALAGVEVRGLKPEHYLEIEWRVAFDTVNLVEYGRSGQSEVMPSLKFFKLVIKPALFIRALLDSACNSKSSVGV
jgi:hypothetical protein